MKENPHYLSRQIITQIGNKRALLPYIADAVETVRTKLRKPRLHILDGFAGSGVVSRLFKSYAQRLVSNDIEQYAAVTARCYLANKSEVDWQEIEDIVADLNRRVLIEKLPMGFIEELYAPEDEEHITAEDRVFYTRENARRIDNYRRLIDEYPSQFRHLLLGPLLHEASVHANTAGVFKGFYKDRRTGVGKFGGTNADALSRIKAPIVMEPPILSNFECEYLVLQEDINAAIRHLDALDLAYYDPPYNQHPYGSNYFMLNLITTYTRPQRISKVSGIPEDWQRSGYNARHRCFWLLRDLLLHTDASFILLSYNNEGFISLEQVYSLLNKIGHVHSIHIPYTVFRGCRNIHKRGFRVTEYLFLVERGK
ncbi:MAG: DNA adenine methylase [Armatimonadota bacterium]|nr:DNA adenine methylase [bacterium]MDW8320422.1 DNA adenine methylase [Armatimonadota bacterium]